jgi:uncharacterized membrane protein
MTPLVAAHALGASLALVLGAVNLLRSRKGDRPHRIIGRVWVVCMYWTVVSSFFIRELDPGRLSWIHGLSVFTFATLTIGLWAAMTGRIHTHRGFMRGSYFGAVGAFLGATVVPQRDIPQLAVEHPVLLSAVVLAVTALTWGIVALARVETPSPTPTATLSQPARFPSSRVSHDVATSTTGPRPANRQVRLGQVSVRGRKAPSSPCRRRCVGLYARSPPCGRL